jgi:predicted dehydrogenase
VIRIAVIGAGHWGPNLIRNFHNHQDSEVLWVCDTSAARIERLRAAYPDVRLTQAWADPLRDPAVEAVVIATPTSTHHALAKAALDADKHVLVEKPIAASTRDGEELAEVAERRGKVLMVGHVFLFNLAVQRVKKYIDSGELGSVYYISMVRTNLGPIRADVNAAWDLASHDISIVDYWLGGAAESAAAAGGCWINKGVDDAVFATLRYPNNVLVSIHASWLNPRKVRDITVVGDKKMLTFDDMNLGEPVRIYDKTVSDEKTQVQLVDSFASFRASVREGDVTIPKVATGEPLKQECMHFLECVRKGSPPLTGAAAGIAVVRTLEAIDRSMTNAGREERV